MPKQPRVEKECRKHGLTQFVFENRGYFRCVKCRIEAVTNARRKRKKKLVEYFGGKCQLCGYDKCQGVLQFHHVDPDTKKFAIASFGVCRAWEKVLTEAKKCVLLCANCHGEVENGITVIEKING